MNPAVTCTNTFNAATIGSILDYRDTRQCLEPVESTAAVLDD